MTAATLASRLAFALALLGAFLTALASITGVASKARAQTALPAQVEAAVRNAVATPAGVEASDVSVLRTEAVTWSSGCLGISQAGTACTQALVDGWVAWASAGGKGYRVHTNLEGGQAKVASSQVELASVAGASLPSGATLRGAAGAGGYKGKVPESGQMALLVTETASSGEQLSSALKAAGCRVESVAIVIGGKWKVYIEGAPDVVNSQFPNSLSTNTAFALRCL